MKNFKILFILHLPPPIHGASTVGKNIFSSHLINSHFECRYINLSASNNLTTVGKLSFSKVWFFIKSYFKILITAIKYKPHLFYLTPTSSGWAFYRDFAIVQTIKKLNSKIILHFHNKGNQNWTNIYFNRKLLSYFFKDVKIILLGEELYFEKSNFINLSSVYFCPNGIPSTNNFFKTFIKKDEITFLFFSNIIIEKGVLTLLEACKILKMRGYQFRCDFVGDWKDITEYTANQYVHNLNLQNEVKFHGPRFDKSKYRFFKNADVFVFPTFYRAETFGLVLLEAMDWSLPCITTMEGVIPSVVEDGVTGFCIDKIDSHKLSDKMIWMIENPIERLEMGLKGKIRFQSYFTKKIFENRMLEILSSAILN